MNQQQTVNTVTQLGAVLVKQLALGLALLPVLMSVNTQAQTATTPVEFKNVPLLQSVSVDPNVFWSLDDSGSMQYDATVVPYWRACAYNTRVPDCANNADRTTLYSGARATLPRVKAAPATWHQTDYVMSLSGGTTTRYGTTATNPIESLNWIGGQSNGVLHAVTNTLGDDFTANGAYENWGYVWDWRFRSGEFNVGYFNPDTAYAPWPHTRRVENAGCASGAAETVCPATGGGTIYKPADFRAARVYPHTSGNADKRDLTYLNGWETRSNAAATSTQYTVSAIAVGNPTRLTVATLPNHVAVGDSVRLTSFTGTHSGDLNNQNFTILSINAARNQIEINRNTSGRTITRSNSTRATPQILLDRKGEQRRLKIDVYSNAAGSTLNSSLSGTHQTLNGFVFEKWLDTHGFNGNAPARTAEGNANGGRNNNPNGRVDLWDDHVRYHVRYCSTTAGTSAAPPTTGDIPWCPQTGYVVEWFYITHYHTGSGNYKTVIRNRGVFAGNQMDNATDFSGNAVGTGKTADQLAQSVANWFQYYRQRIQLLKAAVGGAVRGAPKMRYGMDFFSKFNNTRTAPAHAIAQAESYNHETRNHVLLDALYGLTSFDSRTSLRSSFYHSARYLKDTAPRAYDCQHNFIVLFTDGHYNDQSTTGFNTDEDGDGTSASAADIAYQFYKNPLRGNVADKPVMAPRHEFAIDGKVFPHVTTFPISFGLQGNLLDTDGDGWPDINTANNSSFTLARNAKWTTNSLGVGLNGTITTPSADPDPWKLDDLWHAAYNSDGKYIAAANPKELIDGIFSVLRDIMESTGSSAAAAASAGQLTAGLTAYLPIYNTSDWTGTIRAYEYDLDTRTFEPRDTAYDFAQVMKTQNWQNRQVLTINSETREGVPFAMPLDYQAPGDGEISAYQVDCLLRNKPLGAIQWWVCDSAEDYYYTGSLQTAGQDLIEYLRGAEKSSMRMRKPVSDTSVGPVLGALINSTPAYVADNFRFYPDTLEPSVSNNAFRQQYKNRAPMIYIGSSDGMLHGFNAVTGREELAYVPAGVYHNLRNLSETSYNHQFMVDGALNVVEAFSSDFGGATVVEEDEEGNELPVMTTAAWRSVLMGGLGAGGRGVYALNVTDPTQFSEANADKIVMWEFTDTNTADAADPANGDAAMGHVFGQVEAGKMKNGTWAAVFGNGYNSNSGTAQLLIVDIATGELIHKLDTGEGGTNRKNGLSAVVLADTDGDFVVDAAYGGDMEGNVWAFDLSHANPAQWSFKKIFDGSHEQPVFVKPALLKHPQGGVMVLFGTGRFLGDPDKVEPYPSQFFAGVWDKPGTNTAAVKNDLVEQVITNTTKEVEGEDIRVRTTTNHAVNFSTKRGWFMTLPDAGERVITNPLTIAGATAASSQVRFQTFTPTSSDPCVSNNSIWDMQVQALDGRRPVTAFDINGDNNLDALDNYNENTTISGVNRTADSSGGIPLDPPVTLQDKEFDNVCRQLDQSAASGISAGSAFYCFAREGRNAWRYLQGN